jgi:hypothetical protein
MDGILLFALSNFRHPLLASIQDASTSIFNASVVAPRLVDLRQPTTSHMSIVIGIKPSVFSCIQTSLSISGSSKSANFAGLPFFRQNEKTLCQSTLNLQFQDSSYPVSNTYTRPHHFCHRQIMLPLSILLLEPS